ncbi:TlpA family protein disulfide reductase [Salinimicrobium flavum]|uniref:TlpA family protein disulfide reductase n=1 Tax=Salinimicrobium flavum TaxID=1737065 RepID=A0ABW5IXM8_9FLAO
MKFLKKNWSNILFILFIALLIIPQTRKPIQVTLNRLIAFSPSEVAPEKRETIDSYNWLLADMEGQRHNFRETEGKVAIVNLWATWCPPCIAEMPSFQKLYDEYGEKVNFYFVSSEENEKLQGFLEKKGYSLPVFRPLSQAPGNLQSNTLPTTYVISKKGELVVDKTGAANWHDSKFRKLLDELLEE